jgi:uncharacterized protein (DUF433 family)
MKQSSVVHSDPEILGGTPVFVGTRVPVQALIDYLEGNHSIEEFLSDFPTVSRELAVAALEQANAWWASRSNGYLGFCRARLVESYGSHWRLDRR